MKIRTFLLAALSSAFLFSCSDNDDMGQNPEIRSLSVSISGLGGATKATDPGELVTKDTKNVNSILISLTDLSGNILKTKTVTKNETPDSEWEKLLNPNKGLKFINIPESVGRVYVFGNPQTVTISNNIASVLLENQRESEVVYFGMTSTLTPIQEEPIDPDPTTGQTYTAVVSISPLMSRMQIKSISFEQNGSIEFSREINNVRQTATVTWEDFSADIKGVYMNDFYNGFEYPNTFTGYMSNMTYIDHITEGSWIFEVDGTTVDAAGYASYSNFENGEYQNLPTALAADECYGFNFFPGTTVPRLHLDLANIVVSNMQSTNVDVFNPALAPNERFLNIVKFFKASSPTTEMTPADFKPGTLYNMDLQIVPILDNDLDNVQFNVLVFVTIEDWKEEAILPGFNVDQ